MTCELGCDPEVNVLVVDRQTQTTLMEVEFNRLTWGRSLDDVSQATVQVPYNCCGKLADVRSWRSELHVIRNGDEVWCGPITLMPGCRSGTTIIAEDMFAWLGKRVIHLAHAFPASTPVQIAEALIRDGLAPDDPGLLEFLTIIAGGTNQERDYAANSAYVLDSLEDLAKGGIDFTAIGRRLIVMPEGHVLGQTSLLTCENFLGDLCVTDDGGDAATRTVVTGKAPDDTTVISGSAGGTDPYYGLLEVLLNDDTVKTAASADAQATGLLASSKPNRLLVQPPSGNALDPKAPVCIDQLVPGVEVPLVIDCTCRESHQAMRLIKLDVTVDSNGEQVVPQLSPVDAA